MVKGKVHVKAQPEREIAIKRAVVKDLKTIGLILAIPTFFLGLFLFGILAIALEEIWQLETYCPTCSEKAMRKGKEFNGNPRAISFSGSYRCPNNHTWRVSEINLT